MVGIGDNKRVNEKDMQWLKNGGRDLIINRAKELEKILKEENLIADFNIDIWLEGDDINSDGDCIIIPADDCTENINTIVPEGIVEYDLSWHGHEGAGYIIRQLDILCVENGVYPILDTDVYLNKGLMTVDLVKRYMDKEDEEDKGFAVVDNHGDYIAFTPEEGKLILKALDDADEIPFEKDEKLFDIKCCCCLTADIYRLKFIDRIVIAEKFVQRNEKWGNDRDRELALECLDRLKRFLYRVKSNIVHFEDNRDNERDENKY